MTNERIRIKIAEALGWKQTAGRNGDYIARPNGTEVWHYDNRGNSYGPTNNWQLLLQRKEIPDYPNDLDACHEMEKVLTDEQSEMFADAICRMVCGRTVDAASTYEIAYCIHATARQRCEAFLKTLGLWEEAP